MSSELYPLLFEPVLKDYIWGGRNLEKLGRKLPPEGVIAESWEIAGHEDGTTKVTNGTYAGLPLTELQAKLGLDLIGTNCTWAQERSKFPLLIKLLDANRPLSVQVHPNDEYALANEGNELGKSEMWVVLHAEPGAELILGLSQTVSRQEFHQAILENRLEPYLHHLSVNSGDRVCVPAGTLHAILGGSIIAEIQQNSNTTYRVYDWGRMGKDGNPRTLHIEKALDVIDFEQVKPEIKPPSRIETRTGMRRYLLCENEYFVTERIELDAGMRLLGKCDGTSLQIWGLLTGRAKIKDVALTPVQFTLLPAGMGNFLVQAPTEATLVHTYVA